MNPISREEELELIHASKAGDSSAAILLVKQFENEAYSFLPRHLRNDEDEKQEALKDMWNAINHFDESRGVRLSSAIGTYVINGIRKRWKFSNLKKRKVEGILSLDYRRDDGSSLVEDISQNGFYLGEGVGKDPAEITARREQIQDLGRLIERANLGERSRKVLDLHLRGMNHDEIARELNITPGNSGSLLSLALGKLRNRAKLEEDTKSFLRGEISSPYKNLGGYQRLEYQRVMFETLSERLGVSPERFPWSEIVRYRLVPEGFNRRRKLKHQIVNQFLPYDKRLPDYYFRGGKKWADRDSKRKAFDALENLVLNYAYIISGIKDYSGRTVYERVPWTYGMLQQVFDEKSNSANAEFQRKRLGLDTMQRKKVLLLAYITDNDSNILPAEFQSAKDKIIAHLQMLDGLMPDACLTERQEKVFDLWLKGHSLEEVLELLPGEFQRKRIHLARNELGVVKNKLRVASIQRYRDRFEADADLEQLSIDSQRGYYSTNPYYMNDRYFRIRLGSLIEEMTRDRGWNLDRLPYHLTNANKGKLGKVLLVFDGSFFRMLDFAFPGKFQDWQFKTKAKWDGKEGREKAFEAMDYILKHEQRTLFTRDLCNRYRLSAMVQSCFGSGNYSEANRAYAEEHLRQKSKKCLGRGKSAEKRFIEYSKNRKLFSILFEAMGGFPRLAVHLSDEQMINLDRGILYEAAQISDESCQAWEHRLDLWKYRVSYFYHTEVGEKISRGKTYVSRNFKRTRFLLAKAIQDLYS